MLLRRLLVAGLLSLALTTAIPAAPAAADGPVSTVTADFAATGGTGSPDVFGSAINHLDEPSHVDALRQSGGTFLRRDAYLSEILPNTTLANYRNNVGNVADPNTWDWSKYAWVNTFHDRGFRIMLIMSYSVDWLANPACTQNCSHTPPADYDVYEDIIKKIYQRFQGKVDLVEIWNEPNLPGFLDASAAPYNGDSLRAYRDIYYHAARAVRSVDTTIPIGGPSVADPSPTNWAAALLQDTRIPAANINFLSYHHYSTTVADAVPTWRSVAQANGRGPDFPIYVTEWNWTAAFNRDPMNSDHPDTIGYVGNRLTSLYRQRAAGAAFYADNVESPIDQHFFGTYANGTLTPKARAYRLLSTDLRLGAGTSTIRGISYAAPVTNAGAATTAAGDRVAWVVNDGNDPLQVDLRLTGLRDLTSVRANVFEASADQAMAGPRSTIPLTVSGGAATVPLGVPAKSVVGVRLASYASADETNLAPAAAATASGSSGGLVPALVTDGVIGRWGVGEWASNGSQTPSIKLTWPTSQSIGRVVLYDRSNSTDQINSGTLTFSDGSTVHVPTLPNDGTGKVIAFAPRTVTSVELKVDNGGGSLNAGLSEFQVFAGDNVAPDATVTASSQQDTETHAAANAVDGIAGQPDGQWASTESTPWIRASWLNPRPVTQVVLRDRTGTGGRVNSGTLSFSDGSSIPVSAIPTDGSAKSVTFASRSVSWARFDATGGTGANVGLSEFQVFQAANLATTADVTVSSFYRDPATGLALPGSMATDETINQWYEGEWGSQGETNPWIKLDWKAARTVSSIVIYDRNNLNDHTVGGRLTFSDGSTVDVSGIANSGLGRTVTFPARTASSVTFQLAGAAGSLNAGLSEIQVFG